MIVFSNTNSGAVASLTLNVNGTGAKPIKYINNSSLDNLSAVGQLIAGKPIMFVYDGTNWIATGINYNNTYSSMSEAEAIAGTATTARSITAARLDKAIKSKFADYVIEQGTSGDWTYRKWNSGVAECWMLKTVSITGSSWGGGTEFSGSSYSFPSSLFIAAPVVELGTQSDPSTIPRAWKKSTATDTPVLGAFRPDTSYISTSVSIDFSVHATGRWK